MFTSLPHGLGLGPVWGAAPWPHLSWASGQLFCTLPSASYSCIHLPPVSFPSLALACFPFHLPLLEITMLPLTFLSSSPQLFFLSHLCSWKRVLCCKGEVEGVGSKRGTGWEERIEKIHIKPFQMLEVIPFLSYVLDTIDDKLEWNQLLIPRSLMLLRKMMYVEQQVV